ncbi:peptidase domain-containing ABC transporter [Pseudohongiella spirulinae]|uniref:Toxin secretion ABC transporter ATP-binding subunit/permease n=1 Tax=Pseudohongiella spirulinae TaxID=1249552 RepID=A0A0S2KES0_9GAMM|nr:peptidase domain-containing ABC transporter [Pseudohongiella spirulinae]ALO46844.1 Toxin secretion ABC transporter ATP-binding subunit/permease [Pseudohongiella spirulinae]
MTFFDLFGNSRGLPLILQAERSECGLACLAMISSCFGKHTDLNSLRQHHPVSAAGASLAELMAISAALEMSARPLKIDMPDLANLQLPVILHWDMNHFVVLKKVSSKAIVIHDPAVGIRSYTMEEASRHVTGIALELTPAADFTPGTETRRSRLTDLFRRYPGFYAAVSQLFLLSLLLQLASIGSAFYMQMVIDEGLSRQDRDILGILALAFFLLGLSSVAMTYARSQVQLYFSNQLGFQMAGNVFSHLLGLPVDYFERRHVGDVVSRFGSIREIRRILTEDLITVVLDGVLAMITLAVMFYFNALLAGIVLLFVIATAILKLVFIPKIKSLQEQVLVAEAKTSSGLMENMRAIEIIKFYCREVPRLASWRNLYASQINSQVSLSRFSINIEAVYGVLGAAENILVIYLAALLVIDGHITLGFLTAFVALKGNFTASIRSFIDKLVQIRLVRLQLERVSDITCSEKEVARLQLPTLRRQISGSLEIKGVSYTYPGSGSPVLNNVSLTIDAGQIVGVVGRSGSGKSTLLKIMAGLIKPDQGSVLVDGVDIREFGVRQFRDSCSGVLQTDQLLSGSIMDNITLFDEPVDHKRLELAAKQARIEDFIRSLPMTYNSLVGDMGSIMSAGQKQRILLARTFYKRARIMFLDEATANLDLAVEKELVSEIAGMGISVVMVSHREAPLAIADKIIRFP